jgi:uncharacterized protein with von Willebrand factor type A (vWA) domain
MAGLVYDVSRWSEFQWNSSQQELPLIKETSSIGSQIVPQFPELMSDIFDRLYSYSSKKKEKLRPEDTWAEQAHEQLNEINDFSTLSNNCQGNKLMSGAMTGQLAEAVISHLPTPPSPLEDVQKLRDQVMFLKSILPQAEPQAQEQIKKEVKELIEQGKESVQAFQEWQQSIDENSMRVALREAIKQESKKLEEGQELYESLFPGFDNSQAQCPFGDNNFSQYQEVSQLIANNSYLKKILLLAGRFKRVQNQYLKTIVKEVFSEITNIEVGSELARLLPAALVPLIDPELEIIFQKEYIEQTLLQYQLKSNEKDHHERGPVIVLLDLSGSMKGTRDIWAKAMLLTTLSYAHSQNRPCQVVTYNTTVQSQHTFCPKDPFDYKEFISIISRQPKGGTDCWEAMLKAMHLVQRDKIFEKADICLYSDGMENDFKENRIDIINRFKQKTNSRIILYDLSFDSSSKSLNSSVFPICDEILPIKDNEEFCISNVLLNP